MRGKRWGMEDDRVLSEMFSDERNEVIARRLCCGVRTVERHARLLGLEKSAAFMERSRERARRGAEMWYEYMRLTGRKVGNHGAPGRKFEKGHRFEAEVEERRVKALRDRAWDERVRMMRGLKRRTKWKMVGYEI